MNRISTFASAALLLFAASACSDSPVTPALQPALVPRADGLSCTEADAQLSSGALFEVCVSPATWNGDIVVFIPGYHNPASAPDLPDDLTESPISFLFIQLGYAFATTSFRGSGLVEPDTWIGGDLLELVGTAKTLLHNATGRNTRFVYQTGGSQGGLGTVMALERYPGSFSGGLAACGPIGDYRKQIDYVADFRVVFDYTFTPAIPGWPVWEQHLPTDPGFIDPSTWGAAEQSAGAAVAREESHDGRPDRADLARISVPQEVVILGQVAGQFDHHRPVWELQLHRRRSPGRLCGAGPQGHRCEPAGLEPRLADAAGSGGLPAHRPGERSQSRRDAR